MIQSLFQAAVLVSKTLDQVITIKSAAKRMLPVSWAFMAR